MFGFENWPAFSRALGSLVVYTLVLIGSSWYLPFFSSATVITSDLVRRHSIEMHSRKITAIPDLFRPTIESNSWVVQNELIFTYSKWVSPRVFGKTQKSSSKWWNLKLRDKIWEILIHCKLLKTSETWSFLQNDRVRIWRIWTHLYCQCLPLFLFLSLWLEPRQPGQKTRLDSIKYQTIQLRHSQTVLI